MGRARGWEGAGSGGVVNNRGMGETSALGDAGAGAGAVVVVSGLPRSGTSMVMRMLEAGGVRPLTDGERAADDDNPLGYYELESVKTVRADASWLEDAPGRAVKVIHALLADLPGTHAYRIIFMHRDLDEVLDSQRAMLDRRGRAGAGMDREALKRVFAAQLESARRWAGAQPNCACLDVRYREVIEDPAGQAARIAAFVGAPGSVEAMAAAVSAGLYRNRKG